MSPLPRIALALAALLGLAAPLAAQCDLVWSNTWSNWTTRASYSQAGFDAEVADDFVWTGAITRVQAVGKAPATLTAPVIGARVRFYAWTPDGPGALEADHVFAAGDPGFNASPAPGTVDFQLPTPFFADGQHFLSVQLAFGGSGGAGWQWWSANKDAVQGSPPYARANGGDWAVSSGGFGPANTDANFRLYDDDGTPPTETEFGQWFEIPSPGYPGDHNVLRDLAVIAPDDIWAIGEARLGGDTRGLAMHWDGTAWSVVPVPNPGTGWVDLDGIAAVASDDVWAAGSKRIVHPVDGVVGQQYFVIHWDGASWTEVPTLVTPAGCTGAHLRGVEALGPDEVWFVGGRCQITGAGAHPATALLWDGSGFTEHELPFIGLGGAELEDVAASAPDNVWAVGGGKAGDVWNGSTIYRFDGSTWTHVPGPTVGLGQRLHDVDVLAPDDVWVVGEAWFPGSVEPLVQHWDGTSWTTVPTPVGGGGVLALAPDDVWVSGAGFAHWDGVAFSEVPALACTPGASIGALASAGDGELWAVGRKLTNDVQSLTARLVPSWEDLGGALAGPGAPLAPELRLGGALAEGSTLRLALHQAPADSFGLHVVGASRLDAPVFPLFGGTLIPAPDLLLAFHTDALGRHELQIPVDIAVDPGLTLFVQSWALGTGPVKTVAGSNGRAASSR